MRLIAASLFVIGCMAATVVMIGLIDPFERAPVIILLAPSLSLILSILATLYLFNPWWANSFGLMTQEGLLRRLEAKGLLVSSEFRARRAFAVRENRSEGTSYFLELSDGRVLFLTGTYLWDYEETDDEEEYGAQRPRRFPCTNFTIRSHKVEGCVADILCRGDVLKPEFFALPFRKQKTRWRRVPQNLEVLSDTTYDALKASML